MILNFKITGNIPSKKNSKRIISIHGRPIIISSKNYLVWHTSALIQLKILKIETLFLETIQTITLRISANSKRKFDLTNKAESVMDLLVDYGLLQDDNITVVPKIILIAEPPSKQGFCEIEIIL